MHLSAKTKLLNQFRRVFQNPSLEKLLVKYTVNHSSKSLISRIVPNNYQYKPGSMRVIERNGVYMKLDVSDYVGHYIYFGFADQGLTNLFALCKPGAVMVDVGSNIGYVLLKMAQIGGTNSKVYGFEPDPVNYQACATNVKLNAFKNISLLNIGLGSEEQELYLGVHTVSNRGGNRVVAEVDMAIDSARIQVVKLDEFVSEHRIEKIDLIKIDVEGYELHVLQGAAHTLQTSKPILFIELDDTNLKAQGHSSKELVKFVKELGYEAYHAENGNVITTDQLFDHTHFDIICRPVPV